MENHDIFYEGQVLWSQMDPNRHLRHSAYADFCAQARSNLLNDIGLSLSEFAKYQIGPILFREELIYHKEILLDEKITVKVQMSKYNRSNSRFSFVHEVYKANGVKAATVIVDGAWLDLRLRKLTNVPEEWHSFIDQIPKAEGYTEVD